MADKFNREQFGNLTIGDLRDQTKQQLMSKQISKGLRTQREREKRKKVEKKILDMVFNS